MQQSGLMRLAQCRRGATAVEYGLIAAIVSLSVFGLANAGEALGVLYEMVSQALNGAMPGGAP